VTSNGTGPDALSRSDWPGEDFRLAVIANAHGTVVVAHGELDITTAPELEAVIVAQTGYVVADLREVSFADVGAMQALLRAEARFRRNGDSLTFIPGAAVQRMIGAVGLTGALTLMAPPGASGA
jgi:anti-anti-sigma factor